MIELKTNTKYLIGSSSELLSSYGSLNVKTGEIANFSNFSKRMRLQQ